MVGPRARAVDVEELDLVKGGHWRFVEHAPDGTTSGFEGRFRDIEPLRSVTETFEWDGLPGYPSIQTVTLSDASDGRTKVTIDVLFYTPEERDGMLHSGMRTGMDESHDALDHLLERIC